MKSMILQKMKATAVMTLILLAVIAYGCAEEQTFESAPANNPAITQLAKAADDLKVLRDGVTYGRKKDTYPTDSRTILNDAIAIVSRLVLKIHNGTGVSETELTAAINAAKTAENAFKATKLTADIPWDGVPAELYVDGLNNGYIDFGSQQAYTNFGTGAEQQFTVELWVKMTKVRDDIAAVVAAFRENGGDRNGWMINYRNYDFMRVSYATGSDGRGLFEEGTGYMGRGDWDNKTVDNTNSQWLHIAFVYNDNGRGKLYLNGIIKESRVNWAIGDFMKPDFAPYLNMTAFVQRRENGELTRPVSGYMKHFRIWKKAKTEAEVKELMNGKAVTGLESDLICAWPFDETVENNAEIIDLTGRCTAALRGTFRWIEK